MISATKLIIANAISTIEDSTSGIKRSVCDTIVPIAIKPKAIETYKILLSFIFLYADKDKAQSKAANIPLPNSNISAISPLSKESGVSVNASAFCK